jgi:hypothetical protein
MFQNLFWKIVPFMKSVENMVAPERTQITGKWYTENMLIAYRIAKTKIQKHSPNI